MFTPTDFLKTPTEVADALVAVYLRGNLGLTSERRRLRFYADALGLSVDDVAECCAALQNDDDAGAKSRGRLLARYQATLPQDSEPNL